MPDFSVVLNSVLTMIVLLIPGIIFERFRLVPENFTKGLTNFTLYIAQPFLIINSFLRSFEPSILQSLAIDVALGIVGYGIGFIVVCLLFRKMPIDKKGVLRFMIMFTNAGFMGLPILKSIFGEQGDVAVMYATGVIVCHNVLTWTVGVRLISPQERGKGFKSFINPGVMACVIGVLLFVTSAASFLPKFVTDVSSQLSGLATPLAMYIVGSHLAHFDFRSFFKSWQLSFAVVLRLFILPAIIFGVFYLIKLVGIFPDSSMLFAVPYLQFCMPSASVTTMMAQRYGGDPVYASAGVSVTTLLSLLSIPIMSLLLSLL